MTSTNGSVANIARRFLAVRLYLGLSQQLFSQALGISLRAEQNYERGVRKLPAEVLIEIARKYSIDPLWIMDGPEERPRPLGKVGLDEALLVKSILLVERAVAETGAAIDANQQARMVSAVYQFYMDNASGAGAEQLVMGLVGAAG